MPTITSHIKIHHINRQMCIICVLSAVKSCCQHSYGALSNALRWRAANEIKTPSHVAKFIEILCLPKESKINISFLSASCVVFEFFPLSFCETSFVYTSCEENSEKWRRFVLRFFPFFAANFIITFGIWQLFHLMQAFHSFFSIPVMYVSR